MSQNLPEFRSGVIRPVECLKEAYALIKDQYWLFLGITVVGLLIGGAVPIVLIGPMMCGIHLCLLQRMRGGPVEFGDLFKGFDYFGPSLIATLIQFVPMIILIIPVYIVFFAMMMMIGATQQRNGDPGVALGMIVVMFFLVFIIMLIAVLVQAFFIFMYPLIVDKKLSGVDAVKTSLSAAKANLGGVIGLTLLNFVLLFLGLLCCYIGAFAVLPVTTAATAVMYRKVFPEGFAQPAVAPQWQT
ncbi:MAG: hypothetical protein QOD75_3665 [Blastocatellia bacterium]|jgi:uncharacterized membrane protein|nr:hypothetical protein [Blastocatellia bacterium]